MKLENMIMVVENCKGTETNYLLNFTDYMEMALKLCGEHAEDIAGVISSLYETKEDKREWNELYLAANKSIEAAFCREESQLREFLYGNFNGSKWSFDEERCSKDCLDVLRMQNI